MHCCLWNIVCKNQYKLNDKRISHYSQIIYQFKNGEPFLSKALFNFLSVQRTSSKCKHLFIVFYLFLSFHYLLSEFLPARGEIFARVNRTKFSSEIFVTFIYPRIVCIIQSKRRLRVNKRRKKKYEWKEKDSGSLDQGMHTRFD